MKKAEKEILEILKRGTLKSFCAMRGTTNNDRLRV